MNGKKYGNAPPRGRSSPSQQNVVNVQFYIDEEKKKLNPSLLDEDAEKQADALHRNINSSQIRRFYGEVKDIHRRKKQGGDWNELEPFFRMVKSKALYAKGTKKIPNEFADFLSSNIDRVKDAKDFEAFVLYFEAVLGFAYGKGLVQK